MKVAIHTEEFPLAAPFVIARETIRAIRVIVVELQEGQTVGRGEATPQLVYDQTPESCTRQLEAVRPLVERGVSRAAAQMILPAGSARNALDCALWDFEAKSTGISVFARVNPTKAIAPLVCDMSIGLGPPEQMGRQAARLRDFSFIKVKLDRELVLERISAVRASVPDARLTVDANEAWNLNELKFHAPMLKDIGVEMIEQPLPRGRDWGLIDYDCPVALCADESCFDSADLDYLAGRYDYINIKLDKAGGLTEALALAREASARGFKLMTGCMVSTSLSIAPAFVVASLSEFRDLDGATMLRCDRAPALRVEDGLIHPYSHELWG